MSCDYRSRNECQRDPTHFTKVEFRIQSSRIRKPVYRLGSSKLCIASLFQRDRAAIQQNCRTRVQLDAMLPQAVYVPDGNWLVASNRPLSFTLMCLAGESRQLATKPPISYVQLEPACEAYADGIKLPQKYITPRNVQLSKPCFHLFSSCCNSAIAGPITTIQSAVCSLEFVLFSAMFVS